MRSFRWKVFAGLLVLGPVPLQADRPLQSGILEVQLEGNGQICARMHEPELIQIVFPDRYPQRQFTTYGYRLRLFANRQADPEQKFLLLDSRPIQTVGKKALPKSKTSRNPIPASQARHRPPEFREYWITDSACHQFPTWKKFGLPAGEYELEFMYQAQSPNRSWFVLFEKTSPRLEIRIGESTRIDVHLQDDGRKREIGFPGAEETETAPE